MRHFQYEIYPTNMYAYVLQQNAKIFVLRQVLESTLVFIQMCLKIAIGVNDFYKAKVSQF